jgi:aspartate aminotransferase-like enzyme
MGNIGVAEVAATVQAVESSLTACGLEIEPGLALSAAAAEL